MAENYYYVLNAGKTQSQTLNHTYANRDAPYPNIAFYETSVNPIIKNPGIPSSGDTAGIGGVSANFYEIRKSPYDVNTNVEPMISGNLDTGLVNRIHPAGYSDTVTDVNHISKHASNLQATKSNRLRLKTASTGVLAVGSSGLNMDINERDYFVLINPEVTGNDGVVSIRPHFAKIKDIIQFDNYGDGIEFEPRYPSPVPNGTSYEIYQGPLKTNTSVVAVSYGVRGNSTASNSILSDKYDVSNEVSRPTWYFYEDRLTKKTHLDYSTKYQLTSCRFFKNWTSFGGIALNNSAGTYHTNTINTTYLNSNVFHGHTVWADIGGVKKNLGNLVTYHNSTPTLDDVKYDIPTATDVTGGQSAATIYYGRTVCQSVFLTEPEYGTIINDIGSKGLDAVIVDNQKVKDKAETNYETDSASAFDPISWKLAFPNLLRNAHDRNSNHANYSNDTDYTHVHANLTGPIKYMHYQSSNLKNNGVTSIINTVVNYPRNKATQLAEVTAFDQAGIQFLKLKKNMPLIIRNPLKTGIIGLYKLPYTATSSSVGGYKITLNQIKENFDCRDDDFIKVGDALIVKDVSYMVSAIANPSVTNKNQTLTVNKSKGDRELIYSDMSSISTFTASTIYINNWNGALVGDLPIDTEAHYVSNTFKRLTINGNTISKEKSTLNDNKLIFLSGEFAGLDIPIDYGNSINNQIQLKEPNKQFYIPSSISATNNPSFINYVIGNFAIDEEVFNGTVENTEPRNEGGMITYKISGRDRLSKLLNNTINKNLKYTSDVLHSSLVPMFTKTLTIAVAGNIITTSNQFTSAAASSLKKYDLLFKYATMELIGEVNSISGNTVTMMDNSLIYLSTPGNIKAVSLSNDTTNKFMLTGFKALSVNPTASSNPTDLISAGDKGMVFIDGDELTYAADRSQSTKNLSYSSSNGNYHENKSLGFDVTEVKGIKNNDSKFAFKIGDESTPIVTEINKMIPSSHNYYSILDITEQSGSDTTLTVAPNFPVVLASIEKNPSDTRFSQENDAYLYFLNRNIPNGGFIHRLNYEHTGANYTHDLTFRYQDLQKFTSGTLSKVNINDSHRSIYNELNALPIMAASPAYSIKGYDGSSYTTAELDLLLTKGTQPIEGSNIIDANYSQFYKDNISNYPFKLSDNSEITPPRQFINGLTVDSLVYAGGDMSGGSSHTNAGNLKLTPSMLAGDGPTSVHTNGSVKLINIDPKVKNYELMAIGDIYPESKLRHNHIGYSAKSFSSYGMLLETPETTGNTVTHTNYTGDTKEVLSKDSNFQTAKINASSITSNAIKRWGVMRLVEATYDWHFNPVDAENMPKTSKIPTLPNFQYWRFSEPIQPTTGNGAAITYVDTDYNEGELFFKTDTNTPSTSNRQTVTFVPNDILYNAASGNIIAIYKGTSNVSTYGSSPISPSGDWLLLAESSANMPLYVLRQESTTTLSNTLSLGAPNNIPILNHRWPGLMPFNLYSDTGNGIDSLAEDSIKMTNVYLAREPIDKDYFDYNILSGGAGLNPQNVLIPLISRVDRNKNSTNKKNYAISAWHDTEQWEYQRSNFHDQSSSTSGSTIAAPPYYHISRVMSALAQETFDSASSVSGQTNKPRKYLMGTGHVYDNCTALFRDIQNSFDAMEYNLDDSSAPLDLASLTEYTAFDPSTAENDQDQHGPNVMIKRKGKNAAFVGTRTIQRPLAHEEGRTAATRTSHHQANDVNSGELFNAQMYLKPKINLLGVTGNTLASKGATLSGSTLTFHMNDNSTHNWLAFVNNLTGYYLVSDKTNEGSLPINASNTLASSMSSTSTSMTLYDGTLFPNKGIISVNGTFTHSRGTFVSDEIISYSGKTGNILTGLIRDYTSVTDTTDSLATDLISTPPSHIQSAKVVLRSTDSEGTPVYIGKISSHSVSAVSANSVTRTQHSIVLDKALTISAHGATFRLMRVADTTFKDTPEYFDINKMYDTGLQYNKDTSNLLTGGAGIGNEYSEGVYSMHLLADIDTANNYVERRDVSSVETLFTHGKTYDCYVTDGKNSERKSLNVDLGLSGDSKIRFNYDGSLNGIGMVSFGEVFTITSPSQITNTPTKLHLGVSVSFGTDATTAIEEILEENDVDIDLKDKNVTYTGNIVESVSGSEITLVDNAKGLVNNDFIYTQDANFIGQIASISSKIITIKDMDGDGTYDLYHTPSTYDELTLYTKKPFVLTTNFNESTVFKSLNFLAAKAGLEYTFNNNKIDLQDIDNYSTKRKFSLKYNTGANLISVENNESLFDTATKVIVIGDNVKASIEDPYADNTITLKHIDSNIKDVKEAKVKAEQILELHNTPAKKITLKMQRKGYETMRPGDLISLDFPNHNIPADDYIVFEIEDAMAKIANITVGTFSKTIAERLTELHSSQDDGFTNLFTSNSTVELRTQFIRDVITIREQSLTYIITSSIGNSMGYGVPIGYSSNISYGTQSSGTSSGV